MSENIGFSVYPNPFFINEHGLLNNQGHVRFIYYNPDNLNANLDIYDFTMQHVITLSDKMQIGEGESQTIWDGRNHEGNKVVNGTYFCKLSVNNEIYWIKLVVIN